MAYSYDTKPTGNFTSDDNPTIYAGDDSEVAWDSSLVAWDSRLGSTHDSKPTGSYTHDVKPS